MDAIVLVGGFGTRLMPLTKRLPKPLIPVANVPFIDRTVTWLRDAGVSHVILSLHYNAEQFMAHFAGRDLGVDISYAVEDTPLGTGGAIKNCEPHLRHATCLVANGDIFTNINLPAMVTAHKRAGALASIALQAVEDASRFGAIDTDEESRILRFTEKPPAEQARWRDINTGIYLYEREVFDWFPPGPHSVEREVYPRMLEAGAHLHGYREQTYWTDLGTPRDYLQAHRDILARRVLIPLACRERTPGIWVGEGVRIADDALVRPPVILGDGVRIDHGATVGPAVVLGPHVRIGAGALIEDSVVWERAHLFPDSRVRNSIIGRAAHVGGQLCDAACGDRERLLAGVENAES